MSESGNLSEVVAEIKRLSKRATELAQTRGYVQGVVESVDLDEMVAWVRVLNDETAELLQITPTHGFLPKVGETVMLQLNGSDPFVLAPQTLVDGDMQSRTYVEGVSGWMIDAEGNAEFNDVFVRGYVNGIRVNQPPLAVFNIRGAPYYPKSIPNTTWTTLDDLEATRANSRGDGTTAYDVAWSSARVVPGRIGLWKITAIVAWAINANGTYRRLQVINDDTAVAEDIDIQPPGSGFVMHNISYPIEVTNAAHRYALRVNHNAGGALAVSRVVWMWEFMSD